MFGIHHSLVADAATLRSRPGCPQTVAVKVGEVRLELGPDAVINRKTPSQFTVKQGPARFVVEKQRPGKRVEVLVSHGVIVVVGTRFRIQQFPDHGFVEVEEGRIEFCVPGPANRARGERRRAALLAFKGREGS